MATMDEQQSTAVKNYLFIIIFIFIVFISLGIALKGGVREDVLGDFAPFMQQTSTGALVLFVVAVSLFFTYVPQTVVTRFIYIFMAMLVAITIYMFRMAMESKYVNPYYETAQKVTVLVCALGLLVALWMTNPGGLFTTEYSEVSLVFAFLFGIFVFLGFMIYLTVPTEGIGVYQRSLGILFGVISSAMFIGWVTWMATNYTGKTGWLSIFLSVLLVLILGMLVVKTYHTQFAYKNREKNAFFNLIINTALYIPCLAGVAWDRVWKSIPRPTTSRMSSAAASAAANVRGTPAAAWALLIIAGALLIAYYMMPTFKRRAYLGPGSVLGTIIQLINAPVSLASSSLLGSYEQLRGAPVYDASGGEVTHYNYRYGISCWFYLDALPPNTDVAYTRYSPILSYGNKPLVEYNAERNSLRVCMGSAQSAKPRVVFEQTGIQLQKWINLVVNYSGGTVDVILDGKIVKSVGGVVPYMSLDSLSVGGGGLHGQVCNVIYSQTPFTAADIYYMRYLVKNSTPPVLDLKSFGGATGL